MLNAFSLALSDLTSRRIMSILFKSIAITFVIFAMLGFGLWFASHSLLSSWFGSGSSWVAEMVGLASFILTILSGWLLFRIVAITVIWFFADDIVESVEQRHYPLASLTGRRPNFGQSVGLAARSILRVIGYNIIALPLYLLLLITGVGAPLVFLLVNALLLGRDLEDMLAVRHGRAHNHMPKTERLLLGLAGTGGMMVPIVNLLVPVIATTMAVHLMHAREARQKASGL